MDLVKTAVLLNTLVCTTAELDYEALANTTSGHFRPDQPTKIVIYIVVLLLAISVLIFSCGCLCMAVACCCRRNHRPHNERLDIEARSTYGSGASNDSTPMLALSPPSSEAGSTSFSPTVHPTQGNGLYQGLHTVGQGICKSVRSLPEEIMKAKSRMASDRLTSSTTATKLTMTQLPIGVSSREGGRGEAAPPSYSTFSSELDQELDTAPIIRQAGEPFPPQEQHLAPPSATSSMS